MMAQLRTPSALGESLRTVPTPRSIFAGWVHVTPGESTYLEIEPIADPQLSAGSPDYSRQLELVLSQRLGNPQWLLRQPVIQEALTEHGSIVVGMRAKTTARRRIQDCDAVLTALLEANGKVPLIGLVQESIAIFQPTRLLLSADKICEYCFVREDFKPKIAVTEAIRLLQQHAGELNSPLADAVLVLTEEVERLRQVSPTGPQIEPQREVNEGHPSTIASPVRLLTPAEIVQMPDSEVFDYFEKVKQVEGGPSVADLRKSFAEWLARQSGRTFETAGNNDEQRDAKRRFANSVRDIANFLHCKFVIVATGEIGNLRYVCSGTSRVGQFKIERKKHGIGEALLLSKEFPQLSIAYDLERGRAQSKRV